MKNLYNATQASVKRSLCLALTLWSTAISICVYAEPATYEALAAPVNPPAGYREPWRGTGQYSYDDWSPLRYQQQGNAPGYWESTWNQTFGATPEERKALAEAATGDIWRACRVGYHNYDNMPLAHLNGKNFWKEYASSIFDSLNYCVYPGEEWNLVQRLQSTIADLKYGGTKLDGTTFPGMNSGFYQRPITAYLKDAIISSLIPTVPIRSEDYLNAVIHWSNTNFQQIILLSLSDKRAISRIYYDPTNALALITGLVSGNFCLPENMTQCTQIQTAVIGGQVTEDLPIVENSLYRFHTFSDNIYPVRRKSSTLSLVFAPDTGRLWVEYEYDSLQPITDYCNILAGAATDQQKRVCTFYRKFKEEWMVLNGTDY